MSKLSTNFSSEEFTCNCGCGSSFTEKRLIDALQELRDLVNCKIRILSGYRCIRNNSEAGGGKNSQHLYGKAADIVIEGLTVAQMYEAAIQIEAIYNGGIGVYPDNGFIHVDVRDGKARWARIKKGKGKKRVDTYVSIEEGLARCA